MIPLGNDSPGGSLPGGDSPGGRIPRGVSPRGVIPLGDDSPGGFSQGDDPPGELYPWGRIPQGKCPPGAQWSRTRLSDPSGRGFECRPSPPPLGPKSDRGGHECCEADFGFRIKISGHPVGQSASFFEIYPFRLVRGSGEGPPEAKRPPPGTKPPPPEAKRPPGSKPPSPPDIYPPRLLRVLEQTEHML